MLVTVPPELEGIAAKIQRADEHIAYLNREITAILTANPGKNFVRTYLDPDASTYVVKVAGDIAIDPRLSVVAGEAVHQLRSVLDHLVVALASKNSQRPLNNHQFPICTKREKFEDAVKGGNVKGVPDSALKLIEKEQPYNEAIPHDHYLSVLHYLDVIDKHRLLLVVAAAGTMGDEIRVVSPLEFDISIILPKPDVFRKLVRMAGDKEQEVGRFGLDPFYPAFEAEIDARVLITFDKIGTIEFPEVVPVLTHLRGNVVSLITDFFPEFR